MSEASKWNPQLITYMSVRTTEISALIDEFETEGFLQSTLSFPPSVTLNLDHLSLAGHSIGGATVVYTSAAEPRIKAALGQDSSFQLVTPNMDDLLLKTTPFLNVHADDCVGKDDDMCKEFYGGADSYFEELKKTENKQIERILIHNTTHFVFVDF